MFLHWVDTDDIAKAMKFTVRNFDASDENISKLHWKKRENHQQLGQC